MGDIGPIRHRYEVLPDQVDARRVREHDEALRDQVERRAAQERRPEDLPR